MQHLIIGYGYCGHYLAQNLLNQGQKVTALSRQYPLSLQLDGLTHLSQDMLAPFTWPNEETILYYFAPPHSEGLKDRLLAQFLLNIPVDNLRKVIYCSSSGVYGDHQGAWIDEQANCIIYHARQQRRLDAEHQWQNFCQSNKINYALLRVAGIYGPNRLPLTAAQQQNPIVKIEQAPYSNHIFVKDLAQVAALLSEQSETQHVVNVADGQPHKMGTLQRLVAEQLALPPAPYLEFDEIWQEASPMKREFLESSKRLKISKLLDLLSNLKITPLHDGTDLSLATSKK